MLFTSSPSSSSSCSFTTTSLHLRDLRRTEGRLDHCCPKYVLTYKYNWYPVTKNHRLTEQSADSTRLATCLRPAHRGVEVIVQHWKSFNGTITRSSCSLTAKKTQNSSRHLLEPGGTAGSLDWLPLNPNQLLLTQTRPLQMQRRCSQHI